MNWSRIRDRLRFKRNKDPKEIKKKSFLYEAGETLIIAFVLAMILRTFVVQAFYIPSSSMEDTLLINDMLLANKFIFYFTEPVKGDIVIFRNQEEVPSDSGKDFLIKRVIGGPGDRLQIKSGEIFLNGTRQDEPYIKEKCQYDWIGDIHATRDPTSRYPVLTGNDGEIQIPPDHYFVMGDNRNNSRDSRWFGFLPRKDIIGKALFRYWPLMRIGLIH